MMNNNETDRMENNAPGTQRPAEQRPTAPRTAEQRPTAPRTAEQRPTAPRTADRRPAPQRSAPQRQTPPKPAPQRQTTPRSASRPAAVKERKAAPALPAEALEGENKRRKAAFWIVVSLTFLIVAGFAAYLFVFGGKLGKSDGGAKPIQVEGVNMYDPATAMAQLTFNKPDDVEYPEGIQEKFKAPYAADQHFVGWVSVPNTSIDAAVYQTTDNEAYLKADLWGRWSRYGTIFLDAYSGVKDLRRNTVIYGHNFDDDQDKSFDDYIFGDLHKYLDVEFYKTTPVVEFDTLYEDHKWKVIGCFLTNGEDTGDNGYLFYYIATGMNDDNFMSFIDNVKERSYINTTVDVQPDDKVLTLSTCTYEFDRNGGLQNARCVLVARMVRDGESEEVDVSGATQNDDPRMPQLYYDVFGGQNPFKDAEKWYPAE